MARKDWFASLFFIALAAYAGWVSIVDLKVGTFVKPGPGFFPFLASLTMGVFATLTLAKRWAAQRGPGKTSRQAVSWPPLLITFALLVVYTLVLPLLGYGLTTFLFILALLKVVEKKGWPVSALAALGVTLVAHLVFAKILKSQLPPGPWGF